MSWSLPCPLYGISNMFCVALCKKKKKKNILPTYHTFSAAFAVHHFLIIHSLHSFILFFRVGVTNMATAKYVGYSFLSNFFSKFLKFMEQKSQLETPISTIFPFGGTMFQKSFLDSNSIVLTLVDGFKGKLIGA